MMNVTFCETLQMIVQLVEVIKMFLINEDSTVEKYFRIVVRYIVAGDGEVKQFVVENLKELYFTLKKSFPLGGFLAAYEKQVFSSIKPTTTTKKLVSNKSSSPQNTPLLSIAQSLDF